MAEIHHLDLGRRAEFWARFEALRLLGAVPPGDEHAMTRVDVETQIIFGETSKLRQGYPELDRRLNACGDMVALRVGAEPCSPVDEALAELSKSLREFKCSKCTGLHCKGDEHDHDIVHAHGKCVEPLHDLLARTAALCREIYAEFGASSPTIVLSTWRADANDNTGMLERFGVAGWHKVMAESQSMVGLDLRDWHFTQKSLEALFYLLAHEVVCHAFQDVGSASREDCDANCHWSEAWMDGFAFDLVQLWIEDRQDALPQWVESRSSPIRLASFAMHAQRHGDASGLMAHALMRRKAVLKSYGSLKQSWNKTGPLERGRLAGFLVALNAEPMSPGERTALGLDLAMALWDARTPRFKKTIGLCSQFLEHELPFAEFRAQLTEVLMHE